MRNIYYQIGSRYQTSLNAALHALSAATIILQLLRRVRADKFRYFPQLKVACRLIH